MCNARGRTCGSDAANSVRYEPALRHAFALLLIDGWYVRPTFFYFQLLLIELGPEILGTVLLARVVDECYTLQIIPRVPWLRFCQVPVLRRASWC